MCHYFKTCYGYDLTVGISRSNFSVTFIFVFAATMIVMKKIIIRDLCKNGRTNRTGFGTDFFQACLTLSFSQINE